MNWFLTLLIALFTAPFPVADAGESTPSITYTGETLSIEDIQPGMKGEWRTVVSGTTIESFPLEVVGIIESFVGPDVPIILCKATDPLNTLSGPVSGMSGSPVYIDGKLIGAYAYGFPWSRDKTLIGVTPIGKMLPLLDLKDREHRSAQPPHLTTKKPDLGLGLAPQELTALSSSARELAPQSLPLPLFAGGVDPAVIRHIESWLTERGVHLTTGVGAGVSKKEFSLEPGAPLSVILASGDLYIGGVGTITYRDGDRILAYGHPMMGLGSVELPVGGAEIVDVVSSFRISFKLSNAGPPIGTLWQDSTPGIQAELGRVPYMVPVEVRSSAGDERTIRGDLAEDRNLTPMLALIYMAQSLFTGAEGPANATTYAKLTVDVEGLDQPIETRYRGVGEMGGIVALFRFATIIDQLLNGAETFPRLQNINVELDVHYGEKEELLHAVRLESARPRTGSMVPIEITTRKKDGSLQRYRESVPLPLDQAGSDYSVLIFDAEALETYEALLKANPSRSFTALVRELRQLRENGAIYIRLVHTVPGIRLEGENLENLPPSVIALYQSSLQAPGETILSESILWEGTIPVEGAFSGEARIQFTTEP